MITEMYWILIPRMRVLLVVSCLLTLTGCIATVPKVSKLDDKVQPESLYQSAPWAKQPPVNLSKGFAVAMNTMDSIQGAVQASFDYQNQQVAEYNRIVNDLSDTRNRVYAEQRARSAALATTQDNTPIQSRSLQDELGTYTPPPAATGLDSNFFTREQMTDMMHSVMGVSSGWSNYGRRRMFDSIRASERR